MDYTYILLRGEAADLARAFDTEETAAFEQRHAALVALAEEVGAEGVAADPADGLRVGGFAFADTPDRDVWKPSTYPGTWMPKRSTKAGKAIADKLRTIPTLPSIRPLLEKLTPLIGPVWAFAIDGFQAAYTACVVVGDEVFLRVPVGQAHVGGDHEKFEASGDYATTVSKAHFDRARLSVENV